MSPRLALLVALLVVPATASAAPDADPLRPPADRQPRPPTAAQRRSARAHYARALQLYRKQAYAAARDELELAYRLAPESNLHYAIAMVDVELDRCDDAITELEMFLGTPHGPKATKAAGDAIATCKAKLAPPPPPPPPAPAPPPRPAPVKIHTSVRATRPWYRDRLGDALAIGGAASGLVGLVLYHQALGDLDAADKATTLAGHARDVDDAHRMRTYALVAAGTGLALVTAGLVRYWTRDRGEEPRRSLAVLPTAGGGMIALSGSFE